MTQIPALTYIHSNNPVLQHWSQKAKWIIRVLVRWSYQQLKVFGLQHFICLMSNGGQKMMVWQIQAMQPTLAFLWVLENYLNLRGWPCCWLKSLKIELLHNEAANVLPLWTHFLSHEHRSSKKQSKYLNVLPWFGHNHSIPPHSKNTMNKKRRCYHFCND